MIERRRSYERSTPPRPIVLPVLLLSFYCGLAVQATTHIAILSGTWTSTATWRDASVPPAGADIIILDGVEVDVDTDLSGGNAMNSLSFVSEAGGTVGSSLELLTGFSVEVMGSFNTSDTAVSEVITADS